MLVDANLSIQIGFQGFFFNTKQPFFWFILKVAKMRERSSDLSVTTVTSFSSISHCNSSVYHVTIKSGEMLEMDFQNSFSILWSNVPEFQQLQTSKDKSKNSQHDPPTPISSYKMKVKYFLNIFHYFYFSFAKKKIPIINPTSKAQGTIFTVYF